MKYLCIRYVGIDR